MNNYMQSNYQLPHDEKAEQSILGSMLISSRAVEEVIYDLDEQDFFLEPNRFIFRAMLMIKNEYKAVDVATVFAKLSDLKLQHNIGGMEYLMELSEFVPAPDNVRFYLGIVKEKALMRKVVLVCNSIANEAVQESIEDVSTFIEDAEKRFLEVLRGRQASDLIKVDNVINRVTKKLMLISQNKNQVVGIPSGFADLDRMTNGFQRGALVIIAARPSMGKTAFALNLAKNAAIKGFTVATFSLEMPDEQLVQRIISSVSMVQGGKLQSGDLSNDDWTKYTAGVSKLGALEMYFDDSSTVRVGDIHSKCLKLKQQGKLDLIIIDYLQLLSGSSRKSGDNRQQEVSEISRGLKALARDLDVPVIALSQLSRAVEQRQDKRPMMSDLRESGAIEQDADIVMFLYRANYYDKETNTVDPSPVDVLISKHRNGATGEITLSFTRSISSFNTITYDMEGGE